MNDQPNCKTCIHKGTDFYYGLCPQNDSEILLQERNRCFYYKKIGEIMNNQELRDRINKTAKELFPDISLDFL